MSNNSFRKPFDKESYAQNDQKAKDLAKKLLKQLPAYRKLILQDNLLSEFQVDLMALQASKNEQGQDVFVSVKTVECEVKLAWKSGAYTFPDVRIPIRKEKFKGADWIICRADFKGALYIPAEVVINAPITYVKTKLSDDLEGFITIDPKDCKVLEEDDLY